MQVVVASYNIHSCVGQDGRYDPERVLAVIRELNADIVALQEVDSREHRGLELLRCFGAELGLEPIAGPTLLRDTGHYGNGILTRYAAKDVRRIDLSFPGREPRGALDVDLQCADQILQVVATHLGLRPSERRAQVRRIMDRCRTNYCILMGDLNEWFLWGRPLRWLKAIFGPTPHLQTFPARFPVFALDRIWMHPRNAMRNIEVHRTKPARVASDHLPIKAVIEL